jgi:hypothetical protein
MKAEAGNALRFDGYSGRVAPDWDTPEVRAAILGFRGLLEDPKAEILLRSRNIVTSVRLPVGPGKSAPAVLKSFGMRGVNKAKTRVVRSKAAKAWRGALALVERGIPTAPPIAYWEARRGGTVTESYFLAERLEGVREIRFLLRELRGEALDRLLEQVAAFLAECHSKGILHRDLSDGNILVKESGPGRYAFYLLDTNRVRTRRGIGGLARMKNLVRLGVPVERREFFLGRYRAAAALPERFETWYRLQKTFYAGRVGLKKKLRLKQAARKLGIQ